MRERLTLRERILFGIIATGIVLSIAAPSCDPERAEVRTCLDCGMEAR